MERKTATGFWGWDINTSISKCITDAKDGPLQIEFNGVTIYIDHDSNPDLLYRDWSRAMSGYIKGPVGPHPAATLTQDEIASDAAVERENEAQRQEAHRKWREKQARERAEHDTALAAAPAMEREVAPQNMVASMSATASMRSAYSATGAAMSYTDEQKRKLAGR